MKKIVSFIALFCLAGIASAGDDLKLKDFPVEEKFNCTATSLDLSSLTTTYKKSIKLMAASLGAAPDFAGHYYFVALPTQKPNEGYINYAIIDCVTGKQVANLDKAYALFDEGNANGFRTRRLPSSKLLVIEGLVTDASRADDFKTEYYEMKDNVLTLIKEMPPKVVGH